MRFSIRIPFLLLIALASLTFGACKETTTGPTTGSGNLLNATVSGTALSFTLDLSAAPPSYDSASHRVSFNGTIVGTPTKTLLIAFTFNIDQGTYPTTLTGSDISMVYIEKSGTTTDTYNCDLTTTDCTLTVASHNGDIIDGTFSGTLKSGTTKSVVITDGKFSAKLQRL